MLQFRKPSVVKSPTPYMASFFKRANSLFYVFSKNDPCYNELSAAIIKTFEENENADISSDYFITANIYTILGLLHKKEIREILRGITEKGNTAVPLAVFLKDSLVKVTIALVKGKKLYDKRETIRDRDNKRELDRIKKEFRQ
jgi:hypothetical protein